jgi:EAL domain-containing protein (putative c-di-GMP-specific phosphodiesterase class I)
MALVPISSEKSVSERLGTADVSLSAAKDGGRGRIHEYRPHDSTVIRRHDEMHWVLQLEDALRSDRFQLHFQPIMPLQDESDEGLHYEVLLRVIDESGEVMSPAELLNAAEQFDMATRVDTWVVNAVFDWLLKHPDHIEQLSLCSINLSGASIGDSGFLIFLKEKLQVSEIPLEKIGFEVTENAAIKNMLKARDFINTIKKYGCKFSLDDFGSGHSSFAYLKDLPVDILKIDGIFVKGIHQEPVNYAMVKAINDVGQVMKMKTIAEYVENEEICNSLKKIGVDYGQGYYFGKSENIDEVIVVDPTIATIAEIPG